MDLPLQDDQPPPPQPMLLLQSPRIEIVEDSSDVPMPIKNNLAMEGFNEYAQDINWEMLDEEMMEEDNQIPEAELNIQDDDFDLD